MTATPAPPESVVQSLRRIVWLIRSVPLAPLRYLEEDAGERYRPKSANVIVGRFCSHVFAY